MKDDLLLQLMQVAILLLVAGVGTGVVLTRDVLAQPIAVSFYGILVAIMFFLFHAPDVALSQLTVGTVALPLMILLALARIRRDAEQRGREEQRGDAQSGEEKP